MDATTVEVDRGVITKRVTSNLAAAEINLKRLQRQNSRLMITSVISSATTTVITGWTAAQGPMVGSGPAGWRLSCLMGTVFGFLSTVSLGINQQFKVGDRLAEAKAAVGRLKALDIAIALNNRPWNEIVHEYEELVRTNPDLG